MIMMWLWRSFYFNLVFLVKNNLSICQFDDFSILVIWDLVTLVTDAFSYIHIGELLCVSKLCARITKRLRGYWAALFCVCCFLFHVCISPSFFLKKCYWLRSFGENCGALGQFEMQARFSHMCFVYP